MGTDIIHGTDRIPPPNTSRMLAALALRSNAAAAHGLTSLEQSLDEKVEQRTSALERLWEANRPHEKTDALVLARPARAPVPPKRLSWRGVGVSDELQRYAARVARGEELAPYRGPVLSQRDVAFPWHLQATEKLPLPVSVQSSWSVWQVVVLGLLFIGVTLGGGASLLADQDADANGLAWTGKGTELPPGATRGAPDQDVDVAGSKAASASAQRLATASIAPQPKTRSRQPRLISTSQTRRKGAPRRATASVRAAGAAASNDKNQLFVEAPSF